MTRFLCICFFSLFPFFKLKFNDKDIFYHALHHFFVSDKNRIKVHTWNWRNEQKLNSCNWKHKTPKNPTKMTNNQKISNRKCKKIKKSTQTKKMNNIKMWINENWLNYFCHNSWHWIQHGQIKWFVNFEKSHKTRHFFSF